ncbi:site-specific integrase [Rhizobium sp. 9140]|uniref:site-specific integrase n=1 Tax=Rhizobium sp. 9140 TaxID=1761900 RepID=UPI0007923989|nr:site-specific integrase [Rhizobium sp. 9140]CZT33297.1 hypothetical protein GA0004734_00003220 [Rhizobium sp. 9140]
MELKAPGLKVRPRADGTTAHYWVASAVAKNTEGYPLKTVRVHGTDDEVATRCRVLTAELKEWLTKRGKGTRPTYDGTLRSLIRLYQQTAESSYFEVKSNTRSMYDESLRLLETSVGARRLENVTGIDIRRWHSKFKEPAADGKTERHRRAYKAIQLLRIVIGFGVVMNIAECFRLKTVMEEMRFHVPRGRTAAISFEQTKAICELAISKGRLSIALAQALQFELTLRQIDVIGRWEDAEEVGTGGIVYRGQRWRDGLLWSDIDDKGVLVKTTSKTGKVAEHDTMQYPFLRAIMDLVPIGQRFGPVVKSETTGLPYQQRYFIKMWRTLADACGVPKDVWNRDSRAGGITEGGDAGADIEMLRHHANHDNIATTQRYNRKTLEKTSNVAQLRVAHRNLKNGQKT